MVFCSFIRVIKSSQFYPGLSLVLGSPSSLKWITKTASKVSTLLDFIPYSMLKVKVKIWEITLLIGWLTNQVIASYFYFPLSNHFPLLPWIPLLHSISIRYWSIISSLVFNSLKMLFSQPKLLVSSFLFSSSMTWIKWMSQLSYITPKCGWHTHHMFTLEFYNIKKCGKFKKNISMY